MKQFIKKIVPPRLYRSLRHLNTLFRSACVVFCDYGHYVSVCKELPIGKNGEIIPWYTYPAIEYLRQLDFSKKRVFEYGCGYSSLWWAGRAGEIFSVEDDEHWYQTINQKKLPNQKIFFYKDKDAYISSIRNNGLFDVIIIDGRHRYKCAQFAVEYLAKGGMVILDNSDWFSRSSEFLRSLGFIQIDFFGLGPILGYAWATSVFLGSESNFRPVSNLQPQFPSGGLIYEVEE